jgi:hypothetical protein
MKLTDNELARAGIRLRSPMERRMLDVFTEDGWRLENEDRDWLIHPARDGWVLSPGCGATIRGLRYEMDFELAVCVSGRLNLDFDIEIDGHEWHERTKEQAARDRARDRALARKLVSVLRFTGAEVFASPRRCLTEIYEIVEDATAMDRARTGFAISQELHEQARRLSGDASSLFSHLMHEMKGRHD